MVVLVSTVLRVKAQFNTCSRQGRFGLVRTREGTW